MRLPWAAKGKNKTETAKLLDGALYARGWCEKSFETAILVDKVETPSPTHSIDCYKGRVALEVEWNNKDPCLRQGFEQFPAALRSARDRCWRHNHPYNCTSTVVARE
ncbi:MAG: BglII/BstYI family type II restriction endonuclease [Hyphomicrobium sp.]